MRYAGHGPSDQFLRKDINLTLPEAVQDAQMWLLANMRKGSRLEGSGREDFTEYPEEAVREAIVNAVAHRDYSIEGDGIRITMFADRIEFYSPGRLPGHVTVQNILDERYSRNPVIVQVLARSGHDRAPGLRRQPHDAPDGRVVAAGAGLQGDVRRIPGHALRPRR